MLTFNDKMIMIEIYISGQSNRKIMTQSYRVCKMIASCNRSIMTVVMAAFCYLREKDMLVDFHSKRNDRKMGD